MMIKSSLGFRWSGAVAGLLFAAAFVSNLFAQEPSVQGGQPRFQRLTFRRGAVVNARFAPDGRTIVYSAALDGELAKVFTTSAGSPEPHPLGFSNAFLHSISAKGEMVVGLREIKNGTLVGESLARVPLAGGAPLPLSNGQLPAWVDWAPDGETLALLTSDTEGTRIEYPRGSVIWRSENDAWDLRLSPTGDALAFCELRGSSEQRVVMIDRAGKVVAQAGGWSLPPFIEWMPRGCVAWAPDGKEVWFAATRPGGKDSGLYAMTRSGEVRPVLRAPGDLSLYDIAPDGGVLLTQVDRRVTLAAQAPGEKRDRDLSWFGTSELADLSRDGRQVLFTDSGQEGGGWSVYLRGTDGSPAVRLGDGKALALSPDGRWALAISATDPRRLSLLPTEGGEPQVLPPAAMDIFAAQWLPGGKQLLVGGTEPGKGSRIYVMDIGGEARPVTRPGAWFFVPSPDGKRVATWSYQGTDIYPIGGGEPRAVPGATLSEVPIQWRADGRAIYMGRPFKGGLRIYEVDLATGKHRLWKELMPENFVRTVKMTLDGEAYAYDARSGFSTLFLATGLR
ncbi:MAG TPA: hypothetical protein VH394_01025 [Thermoanaerobaculia bacterium]|jgi:Tol biopolymer transport system component|nr:hypothetical protein [Thermoanaerobaculia bacterium]